MTRGEGISALMGKIVMYLSETQNLFIFKK